MSYHVELVSDAEADILEIYMYILQHDSAPAAQHVLTGLQEKCATLASHPERGHCPPELERIGVREFREIHFKPYRIVYQVVERKVLVHCVLDGRRDLQDLLHRRLLR